MRKILILAFCLLGSGLSGQTKEETSPLKDSLILKYPDATRIKIKKQKNDYRIKFEEKGNKITSIYDMSGNWKETETNLSDENIPENIRQSINRKYKGGRIYNVRLLESREGIFLYRAQVDTERFLFSLELDRNGKILKTDQTRKEAPQPVQESSGGNEGGDNN